MMLLRSAYLLLGLLVVAPSNSDAEQAYPSTPAALDQELSNLPWEFEAITYPLAKSGSTLQLPEGLRLVRGAAARRLLFLTQGTEFPDAEAYLFDPVDETQVILAHVETGYVTLDDWDTLDNDDLLRVIKEKTAEANGARRAHGISPLEIKGWLDQPRLDRHTATAYWSLLAQEETEQGTQRTVNATALKLGRYGFEQLTWVGSIDQYMGSKTSLPQIIKAHNYDLGTGYADYSIGDRLAGFGIASLVAVAAGGESKAGKSILAVIVAVILAFAKKFIILPIMVAVGAVWGLFAKTKRKLTNR